MRNASCKLKYAEFSGLQLDTVNIISDSISDDDEQNYVEWLESEVEKTINNATNILQ